MAQFLSQDWFDEVATLNTNAGDLHLPPTLANLVINLSVTGDTLTTLHLKHGKLAQHHTDNATSTISIDHQILGQLIHQNDINIAIEAFMMGKIRVDGDMTQVMTLQSAKPSQEQKELYKKIKAITEFNT